MNRFRHLLCRHTAIVYAAVIAIALVAEWWIYGVQTHTIHGINSIGIFLRFLGDAALLMIPFWWLGRRYRWWMLAPLFLVAVWEVCSLCYFRFWDDTLGLSSLLLVSNFHSELVRSGISLFRVQDCILLLIPWLIAIPYMCGWRRQVTARPFSIRWKWIASCIGLVWYVLMQIWLTSTAVKADHSSGNYTTFSRLMRLRLYPEIAQNATDLRNNGPMLHLFKMGIQLYRLGSLRTDLDEGERKKIEDFIATNDQSFTPDSITAANRSKNVIMIIVESLNSYSIHTDIAGRPVAPVLRSLTESDGSVTALDIRTQVAVGGSGDGQLMANTGLYPLATFSTAIALGSRNTFPALAKVLARNSNTVVFADGANYWNEYDAFVHYGFETLYTINDYLDLRDKYGDDLAAFNFAEKLIPAIKQPFFLEFITLSMHAPFNGVNVPDKFHAKWIADPKLSTQERDYLQMVNYFDTALGSFIAWLKEHNLYDNTVLIIVSDHSAKTVETADEPAMAFIAANTGITRCIDRTEAQINVYPTILDLLGTIGPKGWRGAGRSMLSPDSSAVLLPDGSFDGFAPDAKEAGSLMHARSISELILRGDYFAR